MSSECICIVQNTQPTILFPRIANDKNPITIYQLVEKMDNIFGMLHKYEEDWIEVSRHSIDKKLQLVFTTIQAASSIRFFSNWITEAERDSFIMKTII